MTDSETKDNDDGSLEDPTTSENLGDTGGTDAPEDGGARAVTIESLQEQLDRANDRLLRARAELENVRKRARRDMDEHRRYANLPLVSDLMPAIDNLDRAVEAAEQNENATGLLEGVKMVATQVQSILAQHHCRRVPTVGSAFDPNVHEAIAQEPSEEVPAGSITRELRVGYQLHDRVIRPSQVMVSTGAPEPTRNE